ncbi:uncharacterized protein CIMG_00914 [Coccidioides immitis RS]|uniref:Uncharacterized protein n=3 Tax=Coccidioides immitis TaxID=5501 RepID=J3KI16_COCIM|nr:uncharacterized protein CIMG_00914 [Coccidioides immitis RS]EAS35560.3 hypothetical protein CIMG_00914 [Coccidioides immitis RS]KMP00812.1 hypothetical protein CIRG_00954 [Coccidioides immitis RMSCC 2394]KMU85476.1 hypothetical protein CIHG_03258 [Coccidioides immitis H538.4]TPX26202.1 hypothetical protein DIZ76_011663 [Coccidioides immitis]
MFAWGGGIAVPTLAVDTEKERAPPPPATPLDFPSYVPDLESRPEDGPTCDKLHQLLSRLKKPQDISAEFLQALNLKVEPDVAPTDLIAGDTLKSLPPFQWPEKSEQSETSASTPAAAAKKLMSNGFPFPDKEKYDLLREELLFDNDDAFRTLSRLSPLPGRPKIRLTHSRKFWTGLEHISQYWDTSLDQYIERSEPEPEPGPANVAETSHDQTPMKDDVPKTPPEDKMDIDSGNVDKDVDMTKSESRTTYKGRRIGTGKDMPESMREDTMRGFLEMIAWSFGCQPSVPVLPPRLFVKGLLFPVRQNFTISRAPQDRQIARKGILEGPILFAQCRGDTEFHGPNGNPQSRYAEICDLLRETAAMLLLAQERSREGNTETKPGDGKWWATEPRWGGAPNDGPVGDPENNQSEDKEKGSAPDADAEKNDNKRPRHDRYSLSLRRAGLGHSKKRSMSEQWKIVQPGPSLWDRKMRYMQIGKPRDSPFDDIFMVSSINHHFAILRLRVHANYIEWLKTGKTNFPVEDAEQPWHRIVLRRTRWFDFFNPEDRVAGLDALWTIFSYMMRPEN